MTTYYLHTLDSKPCYFHPGDKRLYLITKYGRSKPMATSLRQIEREQRMDKNTVGVDRNEWSYGYCRVIAPDGDKQ